MSLEHVFGILSPRFTTRTVAEEAPRKASFFGGLPDCAFGAAPLLREEQDAIATERNDITPAKPVPPQFTPIFLLGLF